MSRSLIHTPIFHRVFSMLASPWVRVRILGFISVRSSGHLVDERVRVPETSRCHCLLAMACSQAVLVYSGGGNPRRTGEYSDHPE
jgi:hypothetical protein